MTVKKCAFLLALLLIGCSSSEAVYLQKNDNAIKCGPYAPQIGDHGSIETTERLRQCVHDYQIQGYRRVPSPADN